MIIGRVLEAVGLHEFKVEFENGSIQTVKSCKLKIASTDEIPPSMSPSVTVTPVVSPTTNPVARSSSLTESDDEESTHGINTEGEIVGNGENDDMNQGTTITNEEEEVVEEALTYEEKVRNAKAKILELTGETVTESSGGKSVVWTVIENHVAEAAERHNSNIGLKPEVLEEVMQNPSMIASSVFMKLMFGESFVPSVVKMNRAIQEYNENERPKRPIKLFSNGDFLRCLSLFIGAVCFAANGNALWKKKNDSEDGWITIEPAANFDRWMKLYRFKEWKRFFASIYADHSRKYTDPWWKFVAGVEFFNLNRLKLLVASNHLCMDEMMVAFRPRKSKTGGLPNLTSLPRKPEPLGTEYKCINCTKTNCTLHLEIQRGKVGMAGTRYHRQLGATAACTVRMSEEW